MMKNGNGERMIRFSTVIVLLTLVVSVLGAVLMWMWHEFTVNPPSTYYLQFVTTKTFDDFQKELNTKLDKITERIDETKREATATREKIDKLIYLQEIEQKK